VNHTVSQLHCHVNLQIPTNTIFLFWLKSGWQQQSTLIPRQDEGSNSLWVLK